MIPGLVLYKKDGRIGLALEELPEGKWKVQFGREYLELIETELEVQSESSARQHALGLQMKIMQLLPTLKSIFKDCPDCASKFLNRYLDAPRF